MKWSIQGPPRYGAVLCGRTAAGRSRTCAPGPWSPVEPTRPPQSGPPAQCPSHPSPAPPRTTGARLKTAASGPPQAVTKEAENRRGNKSNIEKRPGLDHSQWPVTMQAAMTPAQPHVQNQ